MVECERFERLARPAQRYLAERGLSRPARLESRKHAARSWDAQTHLAAQSPSEWKTAQAPHLRIVSDELFEAVQPRKAARRGDASLKAVRAARGPRHMLSGLLRCAACGAGMCSVGASRKGGRARIVCSAHRENGSCGHQRRTYLDIVEDKVIAGLRHHLTHPALLNEFISVYNSERRRLAKEASRERGSLEQALGCRPRDCQSH